MVQIAAEEKRGPKDIFFGTFLPAVFSLLWLGYSAVHLRPLLQETEDMSPEPGQLIYSRNEVWAEVGDRVRVPLQNAPPLKSCTIDSFPGLPNGLLMDSDATIQGLALAAAAMRPYTIELVCKKSKDVMFQTSSVDVLQISIGIISSISQVNYVETDIIYARDKHMRIPAIYDKEMGPLLFRASHPFPQGLSLDPGSGLIQVSSHLVFYFLLPMLASICCSPETRDGSLMLRRLQGTIKEPGMIWHGTITVQNKKDATKSFAFSLAEGTPQERDQHHQVLLYSALFLSTKNYHDGGFLNMLGPAWQSAKKKAREASVAAAADKQQLKKQTPLPHAAHQARRFVF